MIINIAGMRVVSVCTCVCTTIVGYGQVVHIYNTYVCFEAWLLKSTSAKEALRTRGLPFMMHHHKFGSCVWLVY